MDEDRQRYAMHARVFAALANPSVAGAPAQAGTPLSKGEIKAMQQFKMLDFNGLGDAVGGIVVMRFGENPRAVIERVREKIEQLAPSLKGAKVLPVYDRTGLINETVWDYGGLQYVWLDGPAGHFQLPFKRIRQIELTALQKLRQCLSSEQFELLTG